jgi:paraquat-inducible protein B
MSRGRKANPTLIGAFVLGALALAVVAVTVFGSGRFFRNTVKMVCYFSGSVNGLNKGAAVKVRGVQIGSVSEILLSYEQQEGDLRIPVWIEIDQTRLGQLGGSGLDIDQDRLEELIARGLRAKLETESLVTGVLYVGLDFVPGSPIILVLARDSGILEIPTLPTTLEQVFQTFSTVLRRFEKVDLEGLVASARDTFDGVNKVVRSPEVDRAIRSLDEALQSVRKVAHSLEPEVGPAARNLNLAAKQVRSSLEQLDATMTNLQSLVDPQAPLAVKLANSLAELGDMARSVKELADYIDRNPNALLTGRSNK